MVSYGAQGTGWPLHYILYCILFRSLHHHEVMVQILGGSVKKVGETFGLFSRVLLWAAER